MIHGRITLSAALAAVSLSLSVGSSVAIAKEPEAVPGEYVVKLRSSLGAFTTGQLHVLEEQLGGQIKSTIAEDDIVVVKKPIVQTQASAVQSLRQNPLVEIAEPNFIYRAEKAPNDPMFGNLWGMKNIGQNDSENSPGVSGIDINAEKAWDVETGSNKVIVAVIDTGADYNHPDLKDNMWVNTAELRGTAGVDDDGNGYVDDIHGYSFAGADEKMTDPMDDHGHGSHCSGTIGGRGNDGAGIVGVNWNVRIMPVKFLGADGGGSLEGAIRAIDYATKMGAKVLSNSWGGGGYSENLKQAIERAHAAGAVFVAAAGNDSANNDQGGHYPSNYEVANVISVAAIDNKGALADFSNFGKKTVHIAAPGVNIFSSIPNGKYDSWSGTSMATPHVSGVAALVLAHDSRLSNVQLKDRIVSTAKRLATIRNKVISGGMVNAYNAVTNTQSPPDPNDPSLWSKKDVSISTRHPYLPNSKETYEVSVPGAKEISIYFATFETEKSYDTVTLYDQAGNKIAVMNGNYDDAFSPIIPGSYARLVFETDDSVEKNGFDIAKVAYR